VLSGARPAGGIDDFDFVDEFGLATERFSEFRVVGKPGRKHKLRFSYVPVRYEAVAPLQNPIVFDDQVFAGTTSANIKWDIWRFGYEWDVVSRPRGLFGIIGELKYNKTSAAVSSQGIGALVAKKAPIPAAGAIGRVYVHPNVSITGEVTGIKVSSGDTFDTNFWDVDISATASVSKHFGVLGGYHSISADYAIDTDSGNLKLTGAYIGLVSRF
jgi:hypothetical protein